MHLTRAECTALGVQSYDQGLVANDACVDFPGGSDLWVSPHTSGTCGHDPSCLPGFVRPN